MALYIDYSKYPFILSPGELLHLGVERPSIIVLRDSILCEKLRTLVREIIEKAELPQDYCSSIEECVLLYYAALDLAKATRDKWFQNRVALAYSKYASRNLDQESPEKLLLVGRKLGLDVSLSVGEPSIPKLLLVSRSREVKFTPCEFAVSVTSYLRIVSQRLIHDQTYSLVNNIVSNGYVYLDRRTFQRILEETIFYSILKAIEEATPPLDVEGFTELLAEAEKILLEAKRDQYMRRGQEEVSEEGRSTELESKEPLIIEDLFPPCIKRIVNTLRSGGNPSHVERFNLAAFLGNIGLNADSILEYFRSTADFNEKIARYQVEHILGIRGGKKKYLPYSCERMRASGICPVQEQCKGGKNPLAVYKYEVRKRLKSSKGSSKEDSNTASKAAGGI